VAFYYVDIMVEDDISQVESHDQWYKEYHPGGIFGKTSVFIIIILLLSFCLLCAMDVCGLMFCKSTRLTVCKISEDDGSHRRRVGCEG
jgi:hypothetical protein